MNGNEFGCGGGYRNRKWSCVVGLWWLFVVVFLVYDVGVDYI